MERGWARRFRDFRPGRRSLSIQISKTSADVRGTSVFATAHTNWTGSPCGDLLWGSRNPFQDGGLRAALENVNVELHIVNLECAEKINAWVTVVVCSLSSSAPAFIGWDFFVEVSRRKNRRERTDRTAESVAHVWRLEKNLNLLASISTRFTRLAQVWGSCLLF